MEGKKVTAGSGLQLRRMLQFLVLLKACERLGKGGVIQRNKVLYLAVPQDVMTLAPLWH
jgi:hypothetical protein